jgi:hypothetical protein
MFVYGRDRSKTMRNDRHDIDRQRTAERLEIGSLALGSLAAGAFAVGALAIGAFAIWHLFIGRMAVSKARVRDLRIDNLTVRNLQIDGPRPDWVDPRDKEAAKHWAGRGEDYDAAN